MFCSCKMNNYSQSDFGEVLDLLSVEELTNTATNLLRVEGTGNKKNKIFLENDKKIEFEVTFSVPRRVRSDSRTSYPVMLVNAMNSGDLPLMYGFLDTFLTPRAKSISMRLTKGRIDDYHGSHQKGITDIVTSWYTRLQVSPDTVVGLRDVQMIYRPNLTTNAVIISRIVMKATKILGESEHHRQKHESHGDPSCAFICSMCCCGNKHTVEEPASSKYVGQKRSIGEENKEWAHLLEGIKNQVLHFTDTLPLNQEPVSIEVEGGLVLFLDDYARITKIVLSIT